MPLVWHSYDEIETMEVILIINSSPYGMEFGMQLEFIQVDCLSTNKTETTFLMA